MGGHAGGLDSILSAEAEKLAVDPVHYNVSVVAAEKKVTFEFGVRTVGGVESLISFAEKPA